VLGLKVYATTAQLLVTEFCHPKLST
jgi:hypothetical protein